jgi:hypothetical protein
MSSKEEIGGGSSVEGLVRDWKSQPVGYVMTVGTSIRMGSEERNWMQVGQFSIVSIKSGLTS